VKGTIFVPVVCYGWKVDLIQKRGKEYVTIKSVGDNFDECETAALKYAEETKTFLVHPASIHTVVGNGTMAIEILNDMPRKIDYLFIPVG
jgi:threonine dehydratase